MANIYLAGPIKWAQEQAEWLDAATRSRDTPDPDRLAEATRAHGYEHVRAYALAYLASRDHLVYAAYSAFTTTLQSWDARFKVVNDGALALSDELVVITASGVESAGTDAEIEFWRSQGREPFVFVVDDAYDSRQFGKWLEGVAQSIESPIGLTTVAERPTLKVCPTETDSLTPVHVPRRAHAGDAGLDLFVHLDDSEITTGGWSPARGFRLEPGTARDFKCGVNVELPEGYWAMIVGRSSSALRGLSVRTAVIDNGYRGPLFCHVRNDGEESVVIQQHERIAQLVLIPLWQGDVAVSNVLTPSERGERGFGSTGRGIMVEANTVDD